MSLLQPHFRFDITVSHSLIVVKGQNVTFNYTSTPHESQISIKICTMKLIFYQDLSQKWLEGLKYVLVKQQDHFFYNR